MTLRRYLWTLLTVGTAASIAANMAHAHSDTGARIMAVAAPLALLAYTHLVGLWGRVRTSGVTYWAILVTVALIAAGAARVSFAAVRELAATYGYDPLDSALIPLMLDGGLAVTALALVVLGRIEAEAADAQVIPADPATERPVIPINQPEVDQPVTSIDQAITAPIPTDRTIDLPKITAGHEGDRSPITADQETDQAPETPVAGLSETNRPAGATDLPEDHADPSADHSEIARRIAATGRTTQPILVISEVLSARQAGFGLKAAGARAAEVAGLPKALSQSAVSQIETLRDEVSRFEGAAA